MGWERGGAEIIYSIGYLKPVLNWTNCLLAEHTSDIFGRTLIRFLIELL